MEMTLSETSINAQTEERITKSLESQTCLIIKTGNVDCVVYFYPSLYQLTLVKSGIEEKIDLGFSGSRLLERLLQTPGDVVSREDLMRHAWSDRVVGQGSLNQQIYTLRQILGDEKEREIIQTLPRRGYMLNPKYIEVSTRAVQESDTDITADSDNNSHKNHSATPHLPAIAQSPTTPATPNWNALAQLRLPLTAGLCAITVLGFLWTQHHDHGTIKNHTGVTLTYAPENPAQLIQLVPLGEAISEQLENQTSEPLQLVLGSHNEIVTLVCMRTDGSARSLHMHKNKVSSLSGADLAPCL